MGKQVELICVTADNNNKYYRMSENGNGTWTATWGRVGVTALTKDYQMKDWSKKYDEKRKKGYVDVTTLRTEVVTQQFKDVVDREVQDIINTLQRFSKHSVIENYHVSAEQVTQAQLDRAQALINEISSLLKVNSFNRYKIDGLLTQLYTVVPRKMRNVKDHILNGDGTLDKGKQILNREQALIDNMASQVQLSSGNEESKSIEELLGLKIEKTTAEEVENIKKLMGPDASRFKRAFKVTNHKTEKRFIDRKSQSFKNWTKLLWHGSRNENWLSILHHGMQIRPSGVVLTGTMFGSGAYWADKAAKSIGYTSVTGSYWAKGNDKVGFLALFEVNTGMELRVKHHESWMYNIDAKMLQSKGKYDSLFAEGGADLRNNEYITYDEKQCTVRFIVEIKG